jgi:hypothetical protein
VERQHTVTVEAAAVVSAFSKDHSAPIAAQLQLNHQKPESIPPSLIQITH